MIDKSVKPYSLSEEDKQRSWIGSKGNGIYLYDLLTHEEIGHFKNEVNHPNSLCDDNILHVIKDSKQRIWAASFGNGISLVEEINGEMSFRNFLTNKGNRSLIRYLYQDDQGMMWAGSSDGLIRFNPDELIENSEAYICYTTSSDRNRSLGSNDIKTI